MALPLLARGLGSIISVEAVLGGKTLGTELAEFAEELFGKDEHRTEVRIPVASSAIASIGYSVGGIITVEFKRGGTYEYMGSEDLFMAFVNAPSKGQFFNYHFKGVGSTPLPSKPTSPFKIDPSRKRRITKTLQRAMQGQRKRA